MTRHSANQPLTAAAIALTAAAIAVFLLATPAPIQPAPPAPPQTLRQFPVIITRAIDGDTFVITIDLGFSISLADQRVRLLDVDAYERNTTKGLEADALVRTFRGPAIFSSDGKRDSFGRILGRLSVRGRDIGATLEAAGLTTGRWKAPQQPSR